MKKIALFLLIALVLLVSCNQDEIHVHKFDEGTITTAATCTTEGVKTFKCQCGETKTEKVAALGHDKVEVAAQAATCTEVGWDAYEKCKREGCNYTTYEEIAAKGHTEGTPVTTAATCTAAGSTVVKCTVCDAVISTTPIEKLAHTSDDGVVTKEPTCTAKGVKTFSCTVCNTVLKTEDVAAKGHSYGELKTTAATCEKDGEEYKICSVCNDKKVEKTLTKLGHNFKGTETIVKAATCTEKGSKTIKCTRCDNTTTEEIAAKGHTEGTPVTTAATCTAAGSTVVKCTVCDAVISTTSIKQLDHDLEKQSTKSEATCAAKKVVTYKCKNCTHTEDIAEGEVNPANHTGGTEWKVTTPAKYFEKGVETEYCKGCGVSLGNTREVAFKALTGFWEGSTEENSMTVIYTASFANGKMTLGTGMDGAMYGLTGTVYTEYDLQNYTVSTSGITATSEDSSTFFEKVKENGDKITIKFDGLSGEIDVEFERKTTTAHTHTFEGDWEPAEIKKGENIIAVVHTKELGCTEHSPFVFFEQEHTYSGTTGEDSDVCIKCGASKYFSVTQGPSSTKKELGLIKKGDSITLPGENTVVYTLNDTTTTYHGGDTYTPTGDVFITDDAYATLSDSDKTEYSDILSSHVHDLEKQSTKTAATCSEQAVVTFKCKNCDYTVDKKDGDVDLTNHFGDTEWVVTTEAKYFTKGIETKKCKSCNTLLSETRETDFKDLTGFWEGSTEENSMTVIYTASFANGKMTLGTGMDGAMYGLTGTVYTEYDLQNYTVSTSGITATSEDSSTFFEKVKENGDKITMKFEGMSGEVTVEFERKTTTAHTHTFEGDWEPAEIKEGENIIATIHKKNLSCTEHSAFVFFEGRHTYSGTTGEDSNVCTKCGAKEYFAITTMSGDEYKVKCGGSVTLPALPAGYDVWSSICGEQVAGEVFNPTAAQNVLAGFNNAEGVRRDITFTTSSFTSDGYVITAGYKCATHGSLYFDGGKCIDCEKEKYAVGNTVSLGGINWKVLSFDDAEGRALLISKDAVSSRIFSNHSPLLYRDSDVFTYLNNEFYLSSGLRSVTNLVTVRANAENIDFTGSDRLFLLSETEVNTYFADDNARKDFSTDWWLRTTSETEVKYVSRSDGKIYSASPTETKSVRPACWVSIY